GARRQVRADLGPTREAVGVLQPHGSHARSPAVPELCSVNDIERYRLLASAIAGRLVDVAGETPGEPAWTDGDTVFVDASGDGRDVVAATAVQASPLASGSLERDVVANVVRRAVARRYLSLEGHRALAAQEDVLPAVARELVEPAAAARTASPAASLA